MVGLQTEQDRKNKTKKPNTNKKNHKRTSLGISIQYSKKDHVEERIW